MNGEIFAVCMLTACIFGIAFLLYCGWYADRYGKKSNVIGYYNALIESEKQMKAFEEKYSISSNDITTGNYDKNIFIDHVNDKDLYLWEMYIRTFIASGGKLN